MTRRAELMDSLVTSLLQTLPSSRSAAWTKCSTCLFSTAPLYQSPKSQKPRRHVDPYRAAQAKQRKTANQARQKVLQEQRRTALGDPVRSRPTPFVDSLRSSSTTSQHMNFLVNAEDLRKSLAYSRWLTEPLQDPDAKDTEDPKAIRDAQDLHSTRHENAAKALMKIASLESGSSKDRTRANVQRCIDEFGRHNTDSYLPPKPASLQSSGSPKLTLQPMEGEEVEVVPERAGPDTGSSEVQVSILTAKINTLADNLDKSDKHNKRNLRLLVHRRQKHLKYLRRKERGGPRWQNLVEKLGINDAMWKGEISL